MKGFGVAPQELVGAGPTSLRVKSAAKQSALFLFDDQSVQDVLPRYGAHLLANFDESELAAGVFAAVAGVHKMKESDRIPHAMGHYAPHYDPACASKASAPASFAQHLAKARFETAGARNTHVLINALASAILRTGELGGAPLPTFGRKSAHRRLIEAVDGSGAHAAYLSLVEVTLAAQGDFSKATWTSNALPLVEMIAAHLTDAADVVADARAFLQWPDHVVIEEGENAYAPRTDNLFSYPHGEPRVHIRLGSIHSVKGETHTATLVLDTFFHEHHLSELKPWLLGTRSGGLKQKSKGVPELEGERRLGRLKLHYVAMTRPSHLLCLAMRRDAFQDDELQVLKERGWQIVDCCPAISA